MVKAILLRSDNHILLKEVSKNIRAGQSRFNPLCPIISISSELTAVKLIDLLFHGIEVAMVWPIQPDRFKRKLSTLDARERQFRMTSTGTFPNSDSLIQKVREKFFAPNEEPVAG